MRAVEVTVTARHIDEGVPCTTTRCPVALAIMETVRPVRVDVQAGVINFGTGPGQYTAVVPPDEVTWFVDEFDDLLPVEPFTFTLEVPDMLLPATVGAAA